MPFWLHALAVAPALLLLWYFTSRDLYPEPKRLIWLTVALGFGAAAPAALIGEALDGQPPEHCTLRISSLNSRNRLANILRMAATFL